MSVEDAVEADEDVEELLASLAERQESIESFVDTIDLLDRSGMLDLVTVLATHELDKQEQPYEMFSENEKALQLVQNLALFADAASEVDPEQIQQLQQFQDEAADQLADGVPDSKPGLLGIFRQLRDPEIQKGMAVFLALLKAVGGQLDDVQRR